MDKQQGQAFPRLGVTFVVACLGLVMLMGLGHGQETSAAIAATHMPVTNGLSVSALQADQTAEERSARASLQARTSTRSSTRTAKLAAMPRMGTLGQDSDFMVSARDEQGNPVAWDPCKTSLTYRINPYGITPSTLSDIREALSRVGAAAGYSFTYLGDTSVIPFANEGWTSSLVKVDGTRHVASDADLYIATAARGTVPGLGGGTVAIGGGTWSGETRILGGLVLDRNATVAPGFGVGQSRGATLMHELGHVLGLGHTSQANQLMNPVLTSRSAPVFQRGDLSGFRALRARGCSQ